MVSRGCLRYRTKYHSNAAVTKEKLLAKITLQGKRRFLSRELAAENSPEDYGLMFNGLPAGPAPSERDTSFLVDTHYVVSPRSDLLVAIYAEAGPRRVLSLDSAGRCIPLIFR